MLTQHSVPGHRPHGAGQALPVSARARPRSCAGRSAHRSSTQTKVLRESSPRGWASALVVAAHASAFQTYFSPSERKYSYQWYEYLVPAYHWRNRIRARFGDLSVNPLRGERVARKVNDFAKPEAPIFWQRVRNVGQACDAFFELYTCCHF